jgi:2-iminobutanoate/2-iminopropanoate deaminase
MERQIISTKKAPAAIGPYSQGVSWHGLLFCAGQIPLDPATGKIVEGGILDQAARVMQNLKAVLEEGGSSLENVLRLDVYLTELSLFSEVNEFLARIFTDAPPARVTIEVSGLPLGAKIEIAATAAIQ